MPEIAFYTVAFGALTYLIISIACTISSAAWVSSLRKFYGCWWFRVISGAKRCSVFSSIARACNVIPFVYFATK